MVEECAMCSLSPLMNDVYENHKIELLTGAEIANINGTAGHFNVDVKIKPQSVSERCTSCGSVRPFVQSKCQIGGTPTHEQEKLSNKPFPQAVPDRYTIDAEHCVIVVKCAKVCKSDAIELEAKPSLRKIEVGAIVVATGHDDSIQVCGLNMAMVVLKTLLLS